MAKQDEESQLDRRDFLRFLSSGALTLASGGLLVGCGGGGGGSSSGGGGTNSPPSTGPGGTVLFSLTQPITAAGGQVTDTTRKINVVVPAASLTAPTNVQLQVGVSQRANVIPPNYTGNPNSVDVALDPTALAAGQSIQVQISAPGPYDAFGSMMLATNDNGTTIPLAVTYDAGSNMLTGSITTEQFQSLASSAAPHLASAHAMHARPHDLGGILHSIGVFVATIVRVVSPASGTFFVYRTGSNSFESLDGDSMAGQRIAVVVHGIFSNHTDMNALGGMLSGNSAGNSYDAVWCYEYNFGAHIADNGHIFAQMLSAQIASGAQSVDIIAHSMGGLVSRWALEQEGLGSNVKRLITLDTPHEGVPVLAAQLFVYIISGVTGLNIPGIIPGINDLGAPLVIGGVSTPSFLTTLNNPSCYLQSVFRWAACYKPILVGYSATRNSQVATRVKYWRLPLQSDRRLLHLCRNGLQQLCHLWHSRW